MRRGFTLIEMMIALSISAIMLAAVGGLLTSVWMLAKSSRDELQGALHARYVRERLFYGLSDSSGNPLGYGLTSCSDIRFSAPSGFTACRGTTNVWSVDARDAADALRYGLDPDRSGDGDYRNGRPLQLLYLKQEYGVKDRAGYVAYYDRLVVPVFGRHPTAEDLDDCFVR